jgi:uncharacterized protein
VTVLIVDANVLVAVINRRDTHHARMNEPLESRQDEFPATPYLVTEAAYLVLKVAGPDAQITFTQAARDGIIRQETLSEAEPARIVELMGQSRDVPPGAANASVIAAAELLTIQEIASIDGHLRAVRPAAWTSSPSRPEHATPDGARNLAKAARPRNRCVPGHAPPRDPGTAPEILCCTAARYSTWCSTAIMAGPADRDIPGAMRRHEPDKTYKDQRVHQLGVKGSQVQIPSASVSPASPDCWTNVISFGTPATAPPPY